MVYESLSEREKEVLDYLTDGRSNDEIARLLFLSYGRISALVNSLYVKYGIYEQPLRVKLVLTRLKELGKI